MGYLRSPAKYWLRVLAEVKNRATSDVLMVVCDGLKGLPDAIAQVWPQAVTQTCVVHLWRNSFRYASRRDWEAIAKVLRPVYTAPSESAALDALAEFSGQWEAKYPPSSGSGRAPGPSSSRSCASTRRSAR